MQSQKLVHRINRIQGQLNAVKQSIENPNQSCIDTVQLMKAAHSGIKKLSHAYMEAYVQECSSEHKLTHAQQKTMQEILKALFTI